jgi:hypothetical protein
MTVYGPRFRELFASPPTSDLETALDDLSRRVVDDLRHPPAIVVPRAYVPEKTWKERHDDDLLPG